MHSQWLKTSRPRRFMWDMLSFASRIPTVPVQRRMNLGAVAAARVTAGRPAWPAVFLKAYAAVTRDLPFLRRAYVRLPWPHIVEYPKSVASMAVERDYEGEPTVFFGGIGSPAEMSIGQLDTRIREFAERPIGEIKPYRKMLALAGLPKPIRRLGMWLGLNIPRTRAGLFGTFGLTVYSSLGAESLHPLSPLTTTLNYGVIAEDGSVNVRLVYDHRVLDGAMVARALRRLDEQLNGPVLAELRSMAQAAAVAA